MSVGEDTVYSVVVFEYPDGKGPSPDSDSYVKLVNAYAKGSESRLRKRGPATIAGRSGFEAIADDSKGKLSHLIDVIPAGDRIYMLVTAGDRSHATGDDAERFRNSFRLLGDDADLIAIGGKSGRPVGLGSLTPTDGLRRSSTKLCTSRDGAGVNRLAPIITTVPTGTANSAAKSRLTPPQLATARAVSSQAASAAARAPSSAR